MMKWQFMDYGILDQKKQTTLIKDYSFASIATIESAGNNSNFSMKIPVDFAE